MQPLLLQEKVALAQWGSKASTAVATTRPSSMRFSILTNLVLFYCSWCVACSVGVVV